MLLALLVIQCCLYKVNQQADVLEHTMSADLCSTQNRACPPGDPKEGCFLHRGSWQRLETVFTCTCDPREVLQPHNSERLYSSQSAYAPANRPAGSAPTRVHLAVLRCVAAHARSANMPCYIVTRSALISPLARKPEACGAQAAQAGLAMPSALLCPQTSGRSPSKLYSDRLSQPSASQSHALCTTCACAAVVGGQPAREVA